ncbi:hypothetical protein Tco_0872326 [Tanacetum coccineum]
MMIYSHMKLKLLTSYDSKIDDDSEHEADDDMGYDPSDVAFTEWSEMTNVLMIDDYKNDWIYEWNKDVPWVDEKPWTDAGYEALEDSELKDEALRNKAIMEGFIKEDDDERYMMIKYSFNNDEEYVAVKEDEYDDLIITRKEAFQAYQEIFRNMDEGWMVTKAE